MFFVTSIFKAIFLLKSCPFFDLSISLFIWKSAIFHSSKLPFDAEVAEKFLNGILFTYVSIPFELHVELTFHVYLFLRNILLFFWSFVGKRLRLLAKPEQKIVLIHCAYCLLKKQPQIATHQGPA